MATHGWILCFVIFTTFGNKYTKSQKAMLIPSKGELPVAKCLIQILQRYLFGVRKVSIITQSCCKSWTREILKEIDVPVVIDATEFRQSRGVDVRHHSDVVIIFGLPQDLAKIVKETLWIKTTKFLVLPPENITLQELNIMFKEFWTRNVLNAFALIQQDGGNVNVVSYAPYSLPKCDDLEVVIVDKWINGKFEKDCVKIRKGMQIENMNGCSVPISVVHSGPFIVYPMKCRCNNSSHVKGVEGLTLMEFSKRLNFTPVFKTTLRGGTVGRISPKPVGVIGNVYRGRSELAAGMLAPVMDRYRNLDISYPMYGEECLTFGVPPGYRGQPGNWIMVLVAEYPLIVWVLILISLLTAGVVILVVNRIFYREKFLLNVSQLFLWLTAAIFRSPAPLPSSFVLRIVCSTWIWFSFIVTVGYEASMNSKLTAPSKAKELETFQDLVATKLAITGDAQFGEVLKYLEGTPALREAARRYVYFNGTPGRAVDRILNRRDIAYLRQSSAFLYFNLKRKRDVSILKECVFSYFPSFILKKNSIFTKILDDFLTGLKEGGFIEMWRFEYEIGIRDKRRKVQKLAVRNLKGVFYVVSISYGVAVVIFAHEWISHWLNKWVREEDKPKSMPKKMLAIPKERKFCFKKRRGRTPLPRMENRWFSVKMFDHLLSTKPFKTERNFSVVVDSDYHDGFAQTQYNYS